MTIDDCQRLWLIMANRQMIMDNNRKTINDHQKTIERQSKTMADNDRIKGRYFPCPRSYSRI